MAATVSAPADRVSFQSAILAWYSEHGRALNFRRRRDPYAVLVSEAMAQQTQISRVEPAWDAFLRRFPSLESLAAAASADVLRAWAGMGYNRRALNLQRAARMVVEEFGGVIPSRVDVLMRLPGVGPYTARAVAAIAFEVPVGAVDTNVRRVLGRMERGWDGLPAAELQTLADGLVPAGRAREWTHALMDVGARFCRPASPLCPGCPASRWCAAAAAPQPMTGRSGRRLPASSGAAARSGAASVSTPFRSTSRWLRGRLVDRARAAHGDGWVRLPEAIEPHGPEAVAVAMRALAAEGLLELHSSDGTLARLPR